MLPTVHLKGETDPEQVSFTFINLAHDTLQVAKHTVIGSLQLYADCQELQDLKIHQLVLEQSVTTLPCPPPSAKFMCSPSEVNTHRKIISMMLHRVWISTSIE